MNNRPRKKIKRQANYNKNKKINQNKYKNNKKKKRVRIIVNWKAVFKLLLFIFIFIIFIYGYSKRKEIKKYINDYKTKIEVNSKPDEYWNALNNVYTDDDVLISIPVGTYFNYQQKNTCAVKIPRSAKLYAECRYSDMKDYSFNVADGTKSAAESIEDKLLTYKLAIRHMRITCEQSGTKMQYTVYSKDDGNYDTISTLNPNAVKLGNKKHPAVAYYSNNSIFDYELYMYYSIDKETTLHISYSGPLSKILTAEELGECIFNMIDEEYEVLDVVDQNEEFSKDNQDDQEKESEDAEGENADKEDEKDEANYVNDNIEETPTKENKEEQSNVDNNNGKANDA